MLLVFHVPSLSLAIAGQDNTALELLYTFSILFTSTFIVASSFLLQCLFKCWGRALQLEGTYTHAETLLGTQRKLL